ncbi:30S ribosomal protein S16 [Allopontixanthobacter sediminis]|uniref:Small ribosomal subunit protein bS16 n=1 Tax=Allopontixanthobacter sediminis TaxID=1689985 RepID=A0A845AYP7_9SPHN|nr:30S ribosomal protein S16 [Allopontixanthobacter sediminis]MXP43395.1 30S ribosomal protein S16 [Allopontixanthobacter sediminis]
MAIALRLSRGGSKKRPYYRIVAADQRAPRDGKYLEQIGTYNPLLAKDDEKRVTLNEDRARYWLSVGGQPSDRVARFLDAAGVRERAARVNPNKGKPGEKATERAEEKAEKAAAADEAAKTAEEEAKAAPAEEAAVEEAPAEEAPAEEATPEAPAEEAAAEEAPAEEVKAEETPAEETKTEEAPAEDAASEEKTEG